MLETSILKTLAYFDLFDFPLTAEEVFGYLWQGGESTLQEVKGCLGSLVVKGKLETAESFYFFVGRQKLIERRNQAAAEGEKKLQRARFAVKLISGIPFLKAIFVCNSVAAETAVPGSDIDLFIVGRRGRLWLVRFFCNLILKIFRLRTSAKQSADRICLSFFIDDEHLDFSGIRFVEEDVYLVYWTHQLLALYDPENLLEKIRRENTWIRKFVVFKTASVGERYKPDQFKKICEAALGGYGGDWYEKFFKKLQYPKLRKELRSMAELGDRRVIISDIILKFHETDARADIRDRWLANIKKYAN